MAGSATVELGWLVVGAGDFLQPAASIANETAKSSAKDLVMVLPFLMAHPL
jgi:hypothetical protein